MGGKRKAEKKNKKKALEKISKELEAKKDSGSGSGSSSNSNSSSDSSFNAKDPSLEEIGNKLFLESIVEENKTEENIEENKHSDTAVEENIITIHNLPEGINEDHLVIFFKNLGYSVQAAVQVDEKGFFFGYVTCIDQETTLKAKKGIIGGELSDSTLEVIDDKIMAVKKRKDIHETKELNEKKILETKDLQVLDEEHKKEKLKIDIENKDEEEDTKKRSESPDINQHREIKPLFSPNNKSLPLASFDDPELLNESDHHSVDILSSTNSKDSRHIEEESEAGKSKNVVNDEYIIVDSESKRTEKISDEDKHNEESKIKNIEEIKHTEHTEHHKHSENERIIEKAESRPEKSSEIHSTDAKSEEIITPEELKEIEDKQVTTGKEGKAHKVEEFSHPVNIENIVEEKKELNISPVEHNEPKAELEPKSPSVIHKKNSSVEEIVTAEELKDIEDKQLQVLEEEKPSHPISIDKIIEEKKETSIIPAEHHEPKTEIKSEKDPEIYRKTSDVEKIVTAEELKDIEDKQYIKEDNKASDPVSIDIKIIEEKKESNIISIEHHESKAESLPEKIVEIHKKDSTVEEIITPEELKDIEEKQFNIIEEDKINFEEGKTENLFLKEEKPGNSVTINEEIEEIEECSVLSIEHYELNESVEHCELNESINKDNASPAKIDIENPRYSNNQHEIPQEKPSFFNRMNLSIFSGLIILSIALYMKYRKR